MARVRHRADDAKHSYSVTRDLAHAFLNRSPQLEAAPHTPMNRTLPLTTLSLAVLASLSAAQSPTFIPLSGLAQGVATDNGIVVVGGTIGGQVYRWTPADGQVFVGGT